MSLPTARLERPVRSTSTSSLMYRPWGVLVLTLFCWLLVGASQATEGPVSLKQNNLIPAKIDPALLAIGYSGAEHLVYDISWTGGIKIGELHLEVTALAEGPDHYQIKALVTTRNGALNLVYPVHDLHVTRVGGPQRLPYHYEVWQREGYSYRAHRVTDYHQDEGLIVLQKNDKPAGEYRVDGPVNNEFSSFFNSRLMSFVPGAHFIVPTFADKRRVPVVVNVVGIQELSETVFGSVRAVEIMPVMTFKGLYDKKGDTVIWYSDDACRVPLRVNSKIVIGSLTAELMAYDNPACDLYPSVHPERGTEISLLQ
jgi:hypothetical protein